MAGARATQKGLQIAASNMTDAVGVTKSGSDLTQAALVAQASTTVGPGKDGARLEQMKAGF